MPWIKIPPEHHPIFHASLPKDPRVKTINMFGGVAGMVNGNMFGGLFARSAIVRLSPTDQKKALALEGASPFDPMGNGRTMKDTVMLPESLMENSTDLSKWLSRAFEFTLTVPPKKKGRAAAKTPRKRAAPKKKW